MGNRAARYLRISEDRDDDERGVTRQGEATAKLIEQRGWELAATYTDNDTEATSGRSRRDYDAMMAAALRGELDHIVVFHLSRLWRNRIERAQGIEILRRAQITVECVRGPSLDASSAYGRGMIAMLGEIDTLEAEIKGERMETAQADNARAGLHLGGTRPFGWKLIPDPARHGRADALRLVLPVVDDAEAAELRSLAARLLSREWSLAALCRDLNDRGITTTRGKPWTPASLRVTLTRSRNYGAVELGGDEVSRLWPPILAETEVLRIRRLLADPARRTSTGNRTRYLLPGIAVCGKCGQAVKSGSVKNRDGTRRRLYKCPSEHLFRAMAPVDAVTEAAVIARLAASDAVSLLTPEPSPAAGAASAEAGRLRGQLEEALAMWEAGEMTRAEYREATGRLRTRLQAAERAMARLARAPVLAELISAADVGAAWEQLTLDRKRAAIAELVTVTILPAGGGYRSGGRLDATTVGIDIAWKTPD